MLRPYRHSRLVLAESSLAPRLFADYYAGLASMQGAPLVCYWGGAISHEEYEHRREIRPSWIAEEFERACADGPAPDLLVFSVPLIEPCDRAELQRRLVRTFWFELLPATPNERPAAIAYVGYSVGAYLATVLALARVEGRAVAAIGGVGMAAAVAEGHAGWVGSVEFAAFVNADDPCEDETRKLRAALEDRRAALFLHRGRGGHDLADYIDNGSLRAAFAFARENVFTGRRLVV